MSTFAAALAGNHTSIPVSHTANGAITNAHSGHAVLDLFFVLGASRRQDISAKFSAALAQDAMLTLKALFWARDVRGGAGERDTFRKLMVTAEKLVPHQVLRLLPLIPEYGRWDDLHVFETDLIKQAALQVHADAIRAHDGLAAKWAPRRGAVAHALRKLMNMDAKTYRKTIVGLTQVVETAMCAKAWSNINYSHVPSVAHARYQRAFNRRDPIRYAEFKAAAVKGDVKINAGALYPYDVLKSMRNGDEITALAQWQALPNYLGDAGMILPVIDTSGSMQTPVGDPRSKLTCMDVAVSLGLYLADKQQGAFANMFLNFHSNSRIHHLQGNLLEKLHQIQQCDWGGSTNLESALKEILRVAIMGNVPESEMPKYLLVISDMGFDENSMKHKPMQLARDMFERHSYQLPTVIWWNVAHRAGGYGGDNNSPVTQHESGAALISGFSASIMRSVLSSKTVTPWDVMLETLNSERYAAVEAVLHTP